MGEEFDRAGVNTTSLELLFLTYGNALRELQVHFIVTLPISLAYSERRSELPVPDERVFCLPDIPVFDPQHAPHGPGRSAVRAILEARASPELFGSGAMERLVVASGGNIRDLVALTVMATTNALVRNPLGRVEDEDVTTAVRRRRTDYLRSLGQSPYDGGEITYEAKVERLVRIYDQDPTAQSPDPVLYSLFRARAVQEFNGERWFGVHPLVVDLLARQGKVARTPDGVAPGGTE